MAKAFGLYECTVSGDEFGDRRQIVAVSKFKDNLITHCKIKHNQYPVEVNSLGCPPVGTPDVYYVIADTNIESV